MSSRRSVFRVRGSGSAASSPRNVPASRGSPSSNDIITKGGDSAERSGDKNDLKLNYTKFRENVADFVPYKDTPIKELPEEMRGKIYSLKKIFELMRQSEIYPKLIEAVKEAFGDVRTVKKKTVGSFFFGCFVPNSFSGPTHCSAECSGSVMPPMVNGWNTCPSKVLTILDDGQMEINHSPEGSNSHAIIHIFKKDFPGFTTEQIATLRKQGISTVDLWYTGENSAYVAGTKSTPIADLPLMSSLKNSGPKPQIPVFGGMPTAEPSMETPENPKKAKEHKSPPSHSRSRSKKNSSQGTDTDDHHSSSTLNVAGVILGIIFILFVIFLVVLAIRVFAGRKNSGSDAAGKSSDSAPAGMVSTSGAAGDGY